MAALPTPFPPASAPPPPDPGAADAEDRTILAELRSGNFSRFDRFVNRHKGPLLRFLFARVGTIDTAEDLAQDVFISVLRTPASARPDTRISTWLFTIARNRIIDHHRANTRREHAHGTLHLVGTCDSTLDPATAAALQEEHVRLTALFAELPDEQREVLSLRIFGDLSLSEIAQVTGTPLNTIKSRTRYALAKIADRLTQETRS